MSLLTPPSTGHRNEKENRFIPEHQSRVAWSQDHQFHDLSDSPKPLMCSSAKREPPVKSILKKSSYLLLPLIDVKPREVTPEPDDPLMDLHYLEGPVLTIVSPLATMQELNEAYGRLMARLRAAVLNSTDADASWPLFQPIRHCKKEFMDSIVRDLRRALDDPAEKFPNDVPEGLSKAGVSLPSPKHSPKKKGVSAEHVKYARDLCTTSHSAMKFLAFVMGTPAIHKLFNGLFLFGLWRLRCPYIPFARYPTPRTSRRNPCYTQCRNSSYSQCSKNMCTCYLGDSGPAAFAFDSRAVVISHCSCDPSWT